MKSGDEKESEQEKKKRKVIRVKPHISAPVNYPAIQAGRKSSGVFPQSGKKLTTGQAGLIADYLGRV